jgi:hypothetical protein
MKEVIKSLGLKKAPGLDQVTPKMLKELPQEGIVLLTREILVTIQLLLIQYFRLCLDLPVGLSP